MCQKISSRFFSNEFGNGCERTKEMNETILLDHIHHSTVLEQKLHPKTTY